MSDLSSDIQQVKERLARAESLFVITGAGISAESGVPTFRTTGGMWNNIDPTKVATPEAFATDPAFVWSWYDERRTNLKDCLPNPGHLALAELERRIPQSFLLTQNVDDLHEQAGSLQISHIHGKIWETRCTLEGTIRKNRETPLHEIPPHCPACGELERPNVVWFGENIDTVTVDTTEAFLSKGEVDVVMVVGTEASFGYITHWAQRARGASGLLVEINPGRTSLTDEVDIHLCGNSGEILPLLITN